MERITRREVDEKRVFYCRKIRVEKHKNINNDKRYKICISYDKRAAEAIERTAIAAKTGT